MEELVDLIATDSSASEVSDKIKDILYAKAAEKVDNSRPIAASSMFGNIELEPESEDEIETEPETSEEE
jgi:hypothetical protein